MWEFCWYCDSLALKELMVTTPVGMILCPDCAQKLAPARLMEGALLLKKLLDHDPPNVHDWTHRCPAPSVSQQATHVVLPKKTWDQLKEFIAQVEEELTDGS